MVVVIRISLFWVKNKNLLSKFSQFRFPQFLFFTSTTFTVFLMGTFLPRVTEKC